MGFDGFAATRAMVNDCSDMVLRVRGEDIPCVRFNLMAACDIVRFLAEDVDLDRDRRGRVVVPMPELDARTAHVTLDLLHGVAGAADLDRADTERGLRGMDYLGSSVLVPTLLARLWHWIRDADLPEIIGHAGRLILDPAQQPLVMRRLVVLRPLWHDFLAEVVDAVEMDFDIARAIVTHLARFYPASTVLRAVLARLPHPTADKVVALCSMHGCYYHPAEVPDALTAMRHTLARHGLESPVVGLCGTLLEALGTYHVAPLSAARVSGSVILYEAPTVSVLLTVEPECRKPIIVRATSWLRVNVDCESGTMDTSFLLARIDDHGSRQAQLRVTCESQRGASSEMWYMFEDVDGGSWTSLSQCASSFGQGALQMGALHDPKRLRFDLFFDARRNVLERPV